MKAVKIRKGEYIARRQGKVMAWFLLQEGAVIQKFGFSELVLGKNAIIGLLEEEWFICDYIAKEDSVLIEIPCKNEVDLQIILAEHENYRALFMRSAIEQKQQELLLYQELQESAVFLHAFAENLYDRYKGLCQEFGIDEQPFARIEQFGSLELQHKVENWEFNNSYTLVKNYEREYLLLMMKDYALSVGAILEAGAQTRRITQGIGEIEKYLQYNKDILYEENGEDLFHLLFGLAYQLARREMDVEPVKRELKRLIGAMKQLELYEDDVLQKCEDACENYDFEEVANGRINITKEDSVAHILHYAGMEKDTIMEAKNMLDAYRNLDNRQSSGEEAVRLRKQLTEFFYRVYLKAFLHAMKDTEKLSPVMLMFFHFGYMDTGLLGENLTKELYSLTDRLEQFSSDHVFTIFYWLKAIYEGKREPSKNELDVDYPAYLANLRKSGTITEEQQKAMADNREMKVQYEIMNFFTTAHRLTYGRNLSFFPILGAEEFVHSPEKMALTAERVEEAINSIRAVDYSIFFREVVFSDQEHGITGERIQKEVLPDVILMPTAGSRGCFWQELGDARRDSPARIAFPAFTIVDVEQQMVEIAGRYRWEICRRLNGARWNDISSKCLTAQYNDYLQYYRKNRMLSEEAKDRVKNELTRTHNNYREIFVKDYQNWIRFEARGSLRLNRAARVILTGYCPFSKKIRATLASNPFYLTAFNQLDQENHKRIQRLNALYSKYEAAGGTLTQELQDNLNYSKM
jgi:hypothetical protein